MAANQWRDPAGATIVQLFQWAQSLMTLFRRGEHKDYHFVSVTLTAGTSTVVADTKIGGSNDRVFLTPTNAAARALPVHVSARTAGTSFTLTHGAAGGTETYEALVIR